MNSKLAPSLFLNWAVAFILALTVLPASANTIAQTTISSTVAAVCSMSVPPAVDMGEIPFTALSGKTTGDNLEDFARTFRITSSCSGTANYQLTFSPASRGGACIGSDTGTLRFCLRVGDVSLDFTGTNNPVYRATNTNMTVTLVPQMGAYTPKAEVVSGSLTITISPV